MNELICVEKFEDFPQLGRFTLRDEGISVCSVSDATMTSSFHFASLDLFTTCKPASFLPSNKRLQHSVTALKIE